MTYPQSDRSQNLASQGRSKRNSSSESRVLSFDHVIAENTGRFMPPSVYRKSRTAQERLREQTHDMAERLEETGIKCFLDANLTLITDVTRQEIQLPAFRNTNVLPSVAQKNRRDQLNDISYYIENIDGSYWRYGVVTFGERIDAFGDLRGAMSRAKDLLRKWRYICRRDLGIEFGFSGLEFPRNADGTYHLHANVLYKTPFFADGGAEFREITREHFGTWWKDCGQIDNLRELVKYPFKPNDIAGCEGDELRWLFEQTFNKRITEILGPISEFRKARKEARQRVVSVGGKLWLRQIEDVIPRPERDEREEKLSGDPINVIVARVTPSFHTPWAEGGTLVMNYRPNAMSEKARQRLHEVWMWQDQSRQIWDAKGCPDPDTALQFADACMVDENVRALWDSEAHYMVHNETISVLEDTCVVLDHEDDFTEDPPPEPPDRASLRLVIDNTRLPEQTTSAEGLKGMSFLDVFD